jgi:hypothetical protein
MASLPTISAVLALVAAGAILVGIAVHSPRLMYAGLALLALASLGLPLVALMSSVA